MVFESADHSEAGSNMGSSRSSAAKPKSIHKPQSAISNPKSLQLPPRQLGQKVAGYTTMAETVTAMRFLSTNRNTHCDATRHVQVMNAHAGHIAIQSNH
jgi:hypothetical protein